MVAILSQPQYFLSKIISGTWAPIQYKDDILPV